ncbi:MAG: hypothetical protein KC466_04790 [Myxococcales bacterium]|nr:hypothetical protein [Myxococcales bacterium]
MVPTFHASASGGSPTSTNAPKPSRTAPLLAVVLGLIAGAACTPSERPEPPTILRETHMVDDDNEFIHPYVPAYRTTSDGRVALQVQGGPQDLPFWYYAPESLEGPVVAGTPGVHLLATTEPVRVPQPPELSDPRWAQQGHTVICDPIDGGPDGRVNPYPCGPDGTHDCYDFTVIKTTAESIVGAQFWGIPTHVEVANPKTPEARIIEARVGDVVEGSFLPLTNDWTEPAITLDGRLLTGRAGGSPREWTNPETGERFVRQWDLGYFMLPEDAEPCDVTKWTTFTPMSHAPYDPQLKARYGLAAYPFRDTEGKPIEDGEDMGGSYPWVDRTATNLFMTGVPGRISQQSEQQYPRRCVHEGCERLEDPVDWDRGFMVAGLWTHGKLVHLDAMINNLDWAAPVNPLGHRWVKLYRDASGEDVEVRLGAGRGNGPQPRGASANENILDSMQQIHNHQSMARTVTPRDVVWVMSTGIATDEVAFDDYVDPNAFIVSNMQGSITQLRDSRGVTLSTPKYWNGQAWVLLLAFRPLEEFYRLIFDVYDEVHVQNAATSLGWNVPAYGRVEAGTGRIEPTALGGIKGKGLWLDGTDTVRYPIPEQPRPVTAVDWYMGIFLDSRAPNDAPRTLASFADGTVLDLAGRTVRYRADGEVLHEVLLPSGGPGGGWFHVGLRFQSGNRTVTLLADGFALDRFEAPRPMFTMAPGTLAIGEWGPTAGFKGWIDEFKVLAHDVNPEVACNHAHGTLVRIDENPGWSEIAARYPAWAHDEVAAAAGDAGFGARYACFHDYSADYAAHLANLPAGTGSVRAAINFPEGPLRAGVPRPDSTGNAFCLNCHHAKGKGGLSLEALARRADVPAEVDPRRQPHQPPARVFGNIPGGWIAPGPGPGSPAEGFQAPPEGALVDPWLLPGG